MRSRVPPSLKALVAGAVVASTLFARPVVAQPIPPDLVRVTDLGPWMDPTEGFRTTLQISNPTELSLDRPQIRVTLYSRVFSRSQLRASIERRPTGPIGSVTVPVDGPIEPGAIATITIERTARELAPGLNATGVYPLTISLIHARGEQTLTSALPFFAGPPPAPINLTWVLPIARPTIVSPDDVYAVDAVDSLDLAGLDQQLAVIANHPGAPLTLAPTPVLLETLADIANGYRTTTLEGSQEVVAASPQAVSANSILGALRRIATAGTEVATVPYAPVDITTMGRAGLGEDLARHVTLGRSVVEERLGVAPSLGVLVPPDLKLDQSAVGILAPLGASAFVASPTSFVRAPAAPFQPNLFGPSRPITMQGTSARVLLADPGLSSRVSADGQGVLVAQSVIAETASAWLELPLFAPDRVLAMVSDHIPSPPALTALLSGLATAPWLSLRSASSSLAALEPQGQPLPAARPGPRTPAYLAAARDARRALTTMRSILATPLVDDELLDRSILAAQSGEWVDDPSRALALSNPVRDRAKGIVGGVHLLERRVTLTSRSARAVPITILNDTGFELRVRVRVESAKVLFPEGAVRDVDVIGRSETVDVSIQARGAGAFPLDVRIETPDGTTLIATGRLILRSSAVSSVALAAVGGSTLFLGIAYLRRARRREATQRSRAAHPAGSQRSDDTAPSP